MEIVRARKWPLLGSTFMLACGPAINSAPDQASKQAVVVVSDPPGATIVIDHDTLAQSAPSIYHHQRQVLAGIPVPIVFRALTTTPGLCPQIFVVAYNEPAPDTVKFQMNRCPSPEQDFTKPFDHGKVQEPPERLRGPRPVYPTTLLEAQIDGVVLLEAIIDTTGHPEPASVTVVVATNPGFIASAKTALLGSVFRPARVLGRAVRVRITMPFSYSIRQACPPSYPQILCAKKEK